MRVVSVSGSVRFLGIERLLEPGTDCLERRAGTKNLGDSLATQRSGIGIRNDSTPEHKNIADIAVGELLHDPGKQREVRTRKQRQPYSVSILLEHGLGNLLWRLVQTRIDDFESMVAESPRNGLRATIMAIETGFRHDDAVRALHESRTIGEVRRPRRNGGILPPPLLR